MALGQRQIQRVLLIGGPNLHIRAGSDEQPHHLRIPILRCRMQRRPSALLPRVHLRGVFCIPLRDRAFTSAPRSSSVSASVGWPKKHAKCSGVQPSWLYAFTSSGSSPINSTARSRAPAIHAANSSSSTPLSSNNAASSLRPEYFAAVYGPRPFSSFAPSSPALESSSVSTLPRSPARIASKNSWLIVPPAITPEPETPVRSSPTPRPDD